MSADADSNAPPSSASTMICFGATMSMQCASERPRRLVLMQRQPPRPRGEPEPDRQIFGPVRHEQGNHIALADVVRQRPAGIRFMRSASCAMAPGFSIGKERRRCPEPLGDFLHDDREGALRVLARLCAVISSARSQACALRVRFACIGLALSARSGSCTIFAVAPAADQQRRTKHGKSREARTRS